MWAGFFWFAVAGVFVLVAVRLHGRARTMDRLPALYRRARVRPFGWRSFALLSLAFALIFGFVGFVVVLADRPTECERHGRPPRGHPGRPDGAGTRIVAGDGEVLGMIDDGGSVDSPC